MVFAMKIIPFFLFGYLYSFRQMYKRWAELPSSSRFSQWAR